MTQKPSMTFSHIGVCVSDMERSTRFYTEALGFVISHSLEAGAPFHILTEMRELKLQATFMTRGALMIELLYHEIPPAIGSSERRPMNQLGVTHLSFVVDDMEAICELIVKYGGHVYRQTRVGSPVGDMMFCTDPDGVRIELWQKTA
jgi:catechol 2,3-dioxygenase-like lactoylglutathione lyase family enzyme